MGELLSRVSETIVTQAEPNFSSLAMKRGFDTNGLLAIVLDGPARTLALYNDKVEGTSYREISNHKMPTLIGGMPNVSNMTRKRLLALLPTDAASALGSDEGETREIDPLALVVRMYIDMAVPGYRDLPESRH